MSDEVKEIADKVFAILTLMEKIDKSLNAGQPLTLELGEDNNTLMNVLRTHYNFIQVGEDSIELLSIKRDHDDV